jgi:TonB family protein
MSCISPTPSAASTPIAPPAHTFAAASFDPRHPFKVGEDCYPPSAVRLDEEGRCGVLVTIAADGRITVATLASRTGFPLLDEACLSAVRGQRMRLFEYVGRPSSALAVDGIGCRRSHAGIASHRQIEVLNSAEKLEFLVCSQMPDERIIGRGFMRCDIAQGSIFGLYGAVCHHPDTIGIWS